MDEVYKDIVGFFDGENCVPAGETVKYVVPANYASKSKLVEGDMLRLKIMEDGRLIYKQIKHAPRRFFIGTVITIQDGFALTDKEGRQFKISGPTVNYFSLKHGDIVSAATAEGAESKYAVVNNIIQQVADDELEM